MDSIKGDCRKRAVPIFLYLKIVFARFRDFLVFIHPSTGQQNHEGVDGSILFRGARECISWVVAAHFPAAPKFSAEKENRVGGATPSKALVTKHVPFLFSLVLFPFLFLFSLPSPFLSLSFPCPGTCTAVVLVPALAAARDVPQGNDMSSHDP